MQIKAQRVYHVHLYCTFITHPNVIEHIRKFKLLSRVYRNHRIGEFLKELDITDERGTGYPKILLAVKRNDSPKSLLG